MKNVFGDSITADQQSWLAEAYVACEVTDAPNKESAATLDSLREVVVGNAMTEANIPNWEEVKQPPTCEWATEQQLESYVAVSELSEFIALALR